MAENFFDEQSEQSQIKASIVADYFWSWGKVITGHQKAAGKEQKIAYIDLFAGPGRYESGTASTPLLILEQAINDPLFRTSLVSMFNDRDPENVSTLQQAVSALPGIGTLKYAPDIFCEEVGEEIVKQFEELNLIPTLMFVDPWGYKGLSLRLINSVLKNWACECIFFFNFNRINMGLSNSYVREHMAALFGAERAASLRGELEEMNPADRELAIVEALCQALKAMGGAYVLPFCFKNAKGTRTSHHLIFVSKHRLGYKIMKKVMANQSTLVEQGVASFQYNPADRLRQPMLFELTRPLDDLGDMLLDRFAGETLTMAQVYDAHNVGLPYTDTNYKEVLKKLEVAGKIVAHPPHTDRPKRKGEVTFADSVEVTFPVKT